MCPVLGRSINTAYEEGLQHATSQSHMYSLSLQIKPWKTGSAQTADVQTGKADMQITGLWNGAG